MLDAVVEHFILDANAQDDEEDEIPASLLWENPMWENLR